MDSKEKIELYHEAVENAIEEENTDVVDQPQEDDNGGNSGKKPNKKKTRRIITAIVALLVLLLACFMGYKFLNPGDPLENEIKAQLGQLENKSSDEQKAALNEIVEEGTLRVSINMNPVFPNGEAEGSLQIENHPNNHYDIKAIITLDDTGEQVYDSGMMPANSHIQNDVLEINLDAGEYPATATFTAYDPDSGMEIGQVVANIRISVLT